MSLTKPPLRMLLLCALLIASTLLLAGNVHAQSVEVQPIASGFLRITDITNAGDERLFIVEQRGYIYVRQPNGKVSTFLNISAKVDSSGNEQGLLGLAFHPDYDENGYFYVNYTYDPTSSTLDRTRIERYTVSDNPNVANPASALNIVEIVQDFSNHNGGDLNFGPDGMLYIGMGDGGSGGDPNERAQSMTSLLGKMLRIDVDGVSANQPDCGIGESRNYTIPANPFVDGSGGDCDEIWALGLRNPWRVSFDRQTGDLWIGDVGQGQWEEIDFQPASSSGGENYGWDCLEGNALYPPDDPDDPPCDEPATYDAPVFVYPHFAEVFNCSVTGGFVYRDPSYPALAGKYFLADYCSSKFWTLEPDLGSGFNATDLGTIGVSGPTTFGEGSNGELYVSGLPSTANWTVYRIVSTAPTAVGLSSVAADTVGRFFIPVALFTALLLTVLVGQRNRRHAP